jgi:hypothetical protein
MVIFHEDRLNEMAIADISSATDNLPFKIVLKLPDHEPRHAHILDKNDISKEKGQILIPRTKPKSPLDIKDYKKGELSDDDRKIILGWMGKKNKMFTKYTNLEVMNSLWGIASLKK